MGTVQRGLHMMITLSARNQTYGMVLRLPRVLGECIWMV